MKFGVTVTGAEPLHRKLSARAKIIAADVAEAASTALVKEIERNQDPEASFSPVAQMLKQNTRAVSVSDPDAIEREFGTLDKDPSPWLAPVLPAARGPMRAAAINAAVRAISSTRKK